MAVTPGSVCWFECGTKDVAAAKTFYEKLFGWTTEDRPMPGDCPGVYTIVRRQGAEIAGIYELAGPQFEGVPPHWMSYILVENVDESTERAKALGATIVAGPMDIPDVGRMTVFADPTGAYLSMFQLGAHTGMDPDKTNLGWIELHTNDTQAARAFYTELFDWKAKEDAGGYTEFQTGGRSIAGMMAIPPEQKGQVPPNWLPYAMVEDCDACLKQAADLGATIVVPATDIPNVGRFGALADPTGAHIAVIKLSTPAHA